MKDKFLPYKLIKDVYPMRPWFYSPFKGEKDGEPKYKRHWNFIQFNTKMLVERVFGILKGRFKILQKTNRHSITPHVRLGHGLHMFIQHVHF
jgi:hypothetical protein